MYKGKGKIKKGNYSGRFFARKNQFGWVLNLRGMMPSVPCWVVIMGGMMPSVRPQGQPAHSPGQSEAAPWVINTQERFRPARAKAYIIGAMYQRIVNTGSYAFALAGRKLGTDDNTQGAATLCPGLRADCPCGAYRTISLASKNLPSI